MATSNEIFGMIGAAKAFSSSVSESLKIDTEVNENEIRELEQQLEQATDDNEKKSLRKKIKALKTRNKTNRLKSKADKYVQSANNFLTKVASYLDIGIKVIIQWIANFIVTILPPLEVSVKMLLLTNIKKMVSCALDPRIPDEWRYNGVLLNEAMVDPRQILKSSPFDKWGKFNYFGVYYNTEDKDRRPTHEMARAEDMNAFLWYAKNCAKFVTSNVIGNKPLSDYFDVNNDATLFNTHEFKGRDDHRYAPGSTFIYNNNGGTIFLCEKEENRGSDIYYRILPATDRWTGITWYKDRNSISGREQQKDIDYNKSKPLFNIEFLGGYNPEGLIPEGNFRFRILPKPFSTAGGFVVDLGNAINTLDNVVNTTAIELIGTELTDSNIPNYQFPGIQSPLPYTATFNDRGVYDKRGRYSIDTVRFSVQQQPNIAGEDSIVYLLYPRDVLYPSAENIEMRFDKKKKKFSFYNRSLSAYTTSIADVSYLLTECYNGKTVYEFNYDYVMSMKLFDEKSIATGIVDALLNINLPNPFKRGRSGTNGGDSGNAGNTGGRNGSGVNGDAVANTDQMFIDNYVDKMVEKMIDNEEREFTDCFYTFSNEDYEAMERKTSDNVINSTLMTDAGTDSIQEIYDVIDAYDADATLNERVETISLAITKAANACGYSDSTGNGGSYASVYNGSSLVSDSFGGSSVDNGANYATSTGENADVETFMTQAIQFLVSAIVNAVLTPKVLMLLQVNRMMMGTYAVPTYPDALKDNYTLSVQDLLNGLSGLLTGIIREIINTIQKEFLRLILEKLSEMMAGYLKRLGLEYAMKWVTLLKQLIACFKFNSNNANGNAVDGNYGNDVYGNRIYGTQYSDLINNIINQVDSADIDSLVDEIVPNTNPC